MDHTGKIVLSHSFRAVELSIGDTSSGPIQTLNGLDCWIDCHKVRESTWVCTLSACSMFPSLGLKVEYKIRTKNGYEMIGTTDEKIEGSSRIWFQDDPKYYVDGNMTIECHVKFYEIDGNGIWIPLKVIQNETGIGMDLPEKFVLSHSFRAVELPNGDSVRGPTETINGIDCWINCFKIEKSQWVCTLVACSMIPSLGLIVEYKIRTKNGYETLGTTDEKIEDSSQIWFQDDPKYYVDGNMTIECHVKFYEIDGNGIWIPFKEMEQQTGISLEKKFEKAMTMEQQEAKEQQKKKETLPWKLCTICSEEYGEEGDRTPRNLDCGHTLCLGCCKQIAQPNQIQCPFCRVDTQLIGRTVSNLPKNYLALSM